MQVTYKHIRNDEGKLIATKCLILKTGEGETSPAGLGIAILSEKDNFSRKIGRELALKRALKALYSRRDTLPIRIRNLNLRYVRIECGYLYKSSYWIMDGPQC
jgi:hypothetical protein